MIYQLRVQSSTPSIQKPHSLKKGETLFSQFNSTTDQSPNDTKDTRDVVWVDRLSQPDISVIPKQTLGNRVQLKSSIKTMDWRVVSTNMQGSPNIPIKKKEISNTQMKREPSTSLIAKAFETAAGSSPIAQQDKQEAEMAPKRPITVSLGGFKNKVEARGKTPKFVGDTTGLNVAGQSMKKVGGTRDDIEENIEINKKLGQNLAQITRLGSSSSGTFRGDKEILMIELKEKTLAATVSSDIPGKKFAEPEKKAEAGNGAAKGFRMRKLISETPTLSKDSSPQIKVKDPNYNQLNNPIIFRSLPLNVRQEDNSAELSIHVKEEFKPKEGVAGTTTADSRSSKLLTRGTSGVREESGSLNVLYEPFPSSKLSSSRLEKIVNGNAKSSPKINPLKLDVESQYKAEYYRNSQTLEQDDTIKVTEPQGEASVSSSKIRPQKLEGTYPQNSVRSSKRLVKRPAIEALLAQEKEGEKTGQSWEAQRERQSPKMTEEEVNSPPTVSTEFVVENSLKKNRIDLANTKPMRPVSQQRKLMSSVSLAAKSSNDKELDQSQEAAEGGKTNISSNRQGPSVGRILILRKESGSIDKRIEGSSPNLRKENLTIPSGKYSKRGKGGIDEWSYSSANKEEPINMLEKKLINQLGKHDAIEGWDLAISDSEQDSPIEFSPWRGGERKKIVN